MEGCSPNLKDSQSLVMISYRSEQNFCLMFFSSYDHDAKFDNTSISLVSCETKVLLADSRSSFRVFMFQKMAEPVILDCILRK